MAKRNITWTSTADKQFLGILEYWVQRNKTSSYSRKLLKQVADKTSRIAENPYIYKTTNFNDVRVAIMDNFSIFYKIKENEIIITAFWDNRQNPIQLLEVLEKN